MSFKEIRDKLIAMDDQATADWDARVNDRMRGPPGIEERLSFIEYRRALLAGGVGAILSELIANAAGMSSKTRTRRKRRQAKQTSRFGPKAKPACNDGFGVIPALTLEDR